MKVVKVEKFLTALPAPVTLADLFSWFCLAHYIPWKKKKKKSWSILEELKVYLQERISCFSCGKGGQVASHVRKTADANTSKSLGDGDGGRQPIAFPGSHVPGLISARHGHRQQVQVMPLLEHPEVPLETLGVRKLCQRGSVGSRWRDSASLWVENEAKRDGREQNHE